MIILTLIVGCFAILIHTTTAENQYTIRYGEVYNVRLDGRNEIITKYELYNDGGDYVSHAYCLDMNLPCYNGATYKTSSIEDYLQSNQAKQIQAALTYITNTYHWMETTDFAGYQQLTQTTIWRIYHNYEIETIDNLNEAEIKNIANYVYDNIDEILTDYTSNLTLQGTKGPGYATDNYVDYGPFNIKSIILSEMRFNLAFAQNSAPATFVDASGNPITQVKPNEPFYIRTQIDVEGTVEFSTTAANPQAYQYIYNLNLLTELRDDINNLTYQPLIQPLSEPLSNRNTETYTTHTSFTIEKATKTEEIELRTETEKLTLSGLSWNNGNGNGNGGEINQFTVNGVTLKNNKNYITPANFETTITKAPSKNGATAIYTVTEKTTTNSNGTYVKVYDIKVALYQDDAWKGYSGTISVDNPGGNNKNQQTDLTRTF
jgi:hypothetical protein